ncbi:MAG TPA: hypothetical protein VF773_01270 [Verrucomicrobiae bacterium]
MKKLTIALAAFVSPYIHAQTYVDLSQSFNADVFLETGGTGLGDPLDDAGRRIDAGTLPTSFADGSTVTSTNGRATFRFAPLKTQSVDAVMIDGQRIDVTDGRYSSVDLALLSAPGAFANPFSMIDFIYGDGSTNSVRLGPVAGWFSSPTVFDNALFRYSDQSAVTNHVTFPTNGDADVDYLTQSAGNAISGGWRFADGNGYLLYRLDTTGIDAAKLGVTVGNNFVVSVATNYNDPGISVTEGYTKLASSMEIYGVEHRSLGNLKEYEFDVTPYLATGTGELYVLLTDGSTGDGWGPFVQRIRLFEGEALNFEERLRPSINTNDATVYASFQIASAEETPYLFDNSGSGPSNRGHRFADANGSLTYRFDLPDNVTDAKMTVDMENNFVVSIAGPAQGTSYAKFTANTETENTYLVESFGTATQPNARFADASGYIIYEFDLPDTVTTAFARVQVGNQFVISAAAGADGEYSVLRDYVAETGNEIRDNSNLDFHTVNLTSFLASNPTKVVRIKLTDGQPVDGWGPYLRSIEIVDSENSGALNYTEVLNSQTMFGEDFHNEANRGYYTINLSSVLTNNNAGREVNIRFTDGSTSDGWGPSLYWMSVYSGEIEIHSDSLIFPNLKSTQGDPASRPVGLLARNYPLDPAKTLTAIQLPEHPADQTSEVYLLAATLNGGGPVTEPLLTVARVDADTLRISWPVTEGFRLQFTPTLGAAGGGGAQWSNSNASVQTNGEVASVEVNTTGETGFYRLIK